MRTPTQITTAARALIGKTGWSGWCEKLVRTAFGFPARYPHACAAFEASKKAGPIHTDTTPPAGVPVFWDITTGPNAAYDHVAVSIGGGKVISTSVGKNRTPAVIGINELTRLWGMKYLGWAEFYHGQRVYTPSTSIDALAREVIAGKWGNNPQRATALTAAGHDAKAVQARVNQLMKK